MDGQSLRLVIRHRDVGHRARAAVGVEMDGVGVGRPMGVERGDVFVGGRCRHHLAAARRRREPTRERVARARGSRQRSIRTARRVAERRRACRAAVGVERHRSNYARGSRRRTR